MVVPAVPVVMAVLEEVPTAAGPLWAADSEDTGPLWAAASAMAGSEDTDPHRLPGAVAAAVDVCCRSSVLRLLPSWDC